MKGLYHTSYPTYRNGLVELFYVRQKQGRYTNTIAYVIVELWSFDTHLLMESFPYLCRLVMNDRTYIR